MINFAVHLKLTQHCKPNYMPIKFKKKKQPELTNLATGSVTQYHHFGKLFGSIY